MTPQQRTSKPFGWIRRLALGLAIGVLAIEVASETGVASYSRGFDGPWVKVVILTKSQVVWGGTLTHDRATRCYFEQLEVPAGFAWRRLPEVPIPRSLIGGTTNTQWTSGVLTSYSAQWSLLPLATIAIAVPAYLAYRQMRIYRRLRQNCCPACGYSLVGATGAKCPECGGEVSAAKAG